MTLIYMVLSYRGKEYKAPPLPGNMFGKSLAKSLPGIEIVVG
jgi:hypothetical protein